MNRLIAHGTADKTFLDGFRTAYTLHKNGSKNRVSTFSKECEKLLADNAVAELKFSDYWADSWVKADQIQAFLESETKLANNNKNKRVQLLVTEKKPEASTTDESGGLQRG